MTELKRGLGHPQNNVYRKNVACNRYFSELGRSFDSIFEDDTIWINWDPRLHAGFDGFTSSTAAQERDHDLRASFGETSGSSAL